MNEYKATFKFHNTEIKAVARDNEKTVCFIDPITNEETDLKNLSLPSGYEDNELLIMQWRELKHRINNLEPDIGLIIAFYNNSVSNLGDWKEEEAAAVEVGAFLYCLNQEEANTFYKLFVKAKKEILQDEEKILNEDYLLKLIQFYDGRIKQNE